MPLEDEGCGNFDCETCYPGGVIFLQPTGSEFIVAATKSYEV